jgi:YceI-like protein
VQNADYLWVLVFVTGARIERRSAIYVALGMNYPIAKPGGDWRSLVVEIALTGLRGRSSSTSWLYSGRLGPRSARSHIGLISRPPDGQRGPRRFGKFEGQIVTAEDPLRSSVVVTVDLNSVNTGDQARDDDLRSASVFDAATCPAMSYRSAGIRRHGKSLALDGGLIVRTVTQRSR